MVSDGDDSAELETGDEPPDPDMFVTYADNVNAIAEEQPDEAEPAAEVEYETRWKLRRRWNRKRSWKRKRPQPIHRSIPSSKKLLHPSRRCVSLSKRTRVKPPIWTVLPDRWPTFHWTSVRPRA